MNEWRERYPIGKVFHHPTCKTVYKVDGYVPDRPLVVLEVLDSGSMGKYLTGRYQSWHYRNIGRDLLEGRPESSTPDYAEAPELPERDELKWVGIDLDETLARGIWPTPGIGEPIKRNVDKARWLAANGWKVHVHTSRPWHEYEKVKSWLHHNGVPHHGIQMGKPLYAAYIDDRAIFAGDADWTPKPSEVRRADPA